MSKANDLFERAKATVRLHIIGGRRLGRMRASAIFYWRCRATALLRQAIAARGAP